MSDGDWAITCVSIAVLALVSIGVNTWYCLSLMRRVHCRNCHKRLTSL